MKSEMVFFVVGMLVETSIQIEKKRTSPKRLDVNKAESLSMESSSS